MRALLAERMPGSILDAWEDGLLEILRQEGLDRRIALYSLTPGQARKLSLWPEVKQALIKHWGILHTCKVPVQAVPAGFLQNASLDIELCAQCPSIWQTPAAWRTGGPVDDTRLGFARELPMLLQHRRQSTSASYTKTTRLAAQLVSSSRVYKLAQPAWQSGLPLQHWRPGLGWSPHHPCDGCRLTSCAAWQSCACTA